MGVRYVVPWLEDTLCQERMVAGVLQFGCSALKKGHYEI